ncbi:hypothetical protein IG631_23601 [Alternaria alternata]|nr:hypothetical protein IG631_23601 [Alternaria alternata]
MNAECYFLKVEKPATRTTGMPATQGSCRAHASLMIRASECRRTNTECYTHASGAGIEQFKVAPTIHSVTAITGAPILVASRRFV